MREFIKIFFRKKTNWGKNYNGIISCLYCHKAGMQEVGSAQYIILILVVVFSRLALNHFKYQGREKITTQRYEFRVQLVRFCSDNGRLPLTRKNGNSGWKCQRSLPHRRSFCWSRNLSSRTLGRKDCVTRQKSICEKVICKVSEIMYHRLK